MFNNFFLDVRFGVAIKKANDFFDKDVVDQALIEFNMYYRIKGRSITAEADFGKRITIASAKNNNELFFKVVKEIFELCSWKYELKHRETNAKNWRYRRAKAENGHWLYSENNTYKYKAIEDTRKVSFERHIASLSLVFSPDMLIPLIEEYSALMNLCFPDTHWQFDNKSLEFVEISSSKERDDDGKEHPMQNEILR